LAFLNILEKEAIQNGYIPVILDRITLSGKDGNDAKPYQEKEIMEAVKIVTEED